MPILHRPREPMCDGNAEGEGPWHPSESRKFCHLFLSFCRQTELNGLYIGVCGLQVLTASCAPFARGMFLYALIFL